MAAKAKQVKYMQEEYDRLVEELKYRTGEKREEIKAAIKFARSLGDLSENSEHDEARAEQAKNEARISELEAMLENAIIVDESKLDHSVINVGSTVVIYNVEDKEEIEYSIVGSTGADPFANKISDESPIGRALVGNKEGATVTVETPGGVIHLEIRRIHSK